jgi:hypothetical protein
LPGPRPMMVVTKIAAGLIAICAAATVAGVAGGAPPQLPQGQDAAGGRGPALPSVDHLCLSGPGGEVVASPDGEHCLRTAGEP